MKKIFISASFLAIVGVAFIACEKEEVVVAETPQTEKIIVPITKSSVNSIIIPAGYTATDVLNEAKVLANRSVLGDYLSFTIDNNTKDLIITLDNIHQNPMVSGKLISTHSSFAEGYWALHDHVNWGMLDFCMPMTLQSMGNDCWELSDAC